jgi:methionine-rich copper-binding protein CopC
MYKRMLIVAVTAAALGGIATPADAHTSLRHASPGSGATVDPPAQIVLTYADPIIVPQVIVTDQAGGRHESGRARVVDATVTQRVGGRLAPGVYQVGWRVVAPDGHPVSGAYRFTVRGDATPGSPAAPGGVVAPGNGASRAVSPPGSTGSERSSTGSGWWWVGLAAVLAALAGGAGALTRRRSGR